MSFRKVLTFKVAGQNWEIGFGNAGKSEGYPNDGICIYDIRRIVIKSLRTGRGRTLLDVVAHELAHARFRDLEEDAIVEIGEIISVVYPKMLEVEEAQSKKTRKKEVK